jgi:LacI family transcriptional regulator
LNPTSRRRVSEQTKQRVDEAAAALGYTTNAIARSLRTRHSSMVGVMIPDLTNLMFPATVRGIEAGLDAADLITLLVNTDNDPEREARASNVLVSQQVDGLILASARSDAREALPAGVPTVLLYDTLDDATAPSVVVDNADGTRQAVEHLRSLGHRDIAYLAGPQSRSPAVERKQGFVTAMGGDYRPELVRECHAFSEESGGTELARLLDTERFTAVVAASDHLAVGGLAVLRERGLGCPDDLSLVGFHDMPHMDNLRLTTVRVPHHQAGLEAARLLLRLIRGEQVGPLQVRVPVHLVVRDSTGAPRT